MKYAIPVSNGTLCPHFGHCEHFALIEVDDAKKEIRNKELLTPPEHQPGVFPPWLAGLGVNCVITGGMGMNAQNLFANHGITVVVGATEKDPEKAVWHHLQGTLDTGDNACDH